MTTATIILTVFIGILVLFLNFMMCYGGVVFWKDGQKFLSVVFFCTVIALTASFIDTVVRMWIE